MEELSNKLVITLLVLIVVSTIISTIAFMNLEPVPIAAPEGETTGSARASIHIVDSLPEERKETTTAQASIEIREPSG